MIPSRTRSPEKSPKASSAQGWYNARGQDSSVCEVGQDPQVDFAACDRFDLRGESFARRVDRVCAHRIAHIINEVDDEESADGGVCDHAYLEVTRAAAEFLEDGVNRIRFGEQVSLCS
jgi:hypothetical protein